MVYTRYFLIFLEYTIDFDTGYFFDNIASREIDFKGFEQYFKLPFKQIIVC